MVPIRFISLLIIALIGCAYSAPIYLPHSHNAAYSVNVAAPELGKRHIGHRVLHAAGKYLPTLSKPHSSAAISKTAHMKLEIEQKLKPKPSKAAFWSGGLHKEGETWIHMHQDVKDLAKKGRQQLLKKGLEKAGIKKPGFHKDPEFYRQFWDKASTTWAEKASGKVVAYLGSYVRPDSRYLRLEKPELLKNEKVTELVEHNMVTGERTHVKGGPK